MRKSGSDAGDDASESRDGDSGTPGDAGSLADGTVIVDPETGNASAPTGAGIGNGGGDSGGSGGAGGTGPVGKKRGPKPGSKRAPKKVSADLKGLEKLLFSVHAMGAAFLSCPELMLDHEEAKILGDATADVARHYNVVIDEKTQAWLSLCMALSTVYGPRIFAIYARTTTTKPTVKKDEPEKVVPFPMQPNAPLN